LRPTRQEATSPPGRQSGPSPPASAFAARARTQQEVGEPVEVDRGQRIRVRNREDRALGTAADRSHEEKPRSALAPARQDEALQLGQRRVCLVDLLLEPAQRFFRDAQPVLYAEGNREVGAEVEELVLDAVEAARPADERVELVHVAHRGHPRVELRDARPVAETRLALVPTARVDARQADGLVALAHPRSLRR